AVPSVTSVELLDSALARLAGTGATVVLTSGNHDSPERLGFGRGLMKAGVHLLTDVPGIEHPVSVGDAHGEVLFFGLPYLEPDRARTELVATAHRRWPAATRRSPAPRWTGCASAPPPTPVPAPWCSPTPSSPAGTRATPNATSPSAASTPCPPGCSAASTTWRSATCTGSRTSPATSAPPPGTPARPWPSPSPRRTTASPC